MKKITLLTFLSSLVLSACTPQMILSAYDRNEIKWSLKKGTGKVEGSAFLSRNDGILVKCAGKEVSLIAVGEYSTERITKIYGSYLGGYRSVYGRGVVQGPPEYYSDDRNTVCDVDGKFSFKNVPAGKYYITTSVLWLIGYTWQGGFLSKLIEVKEGKTTKIVLGH